jgi:hypothetical protein
MREDFEKLIQDTTLGTLAFGIAIGWSLFSVAHGLAIFVDGLTTHLSSQEGPFSQTVSGGGLTWVVGHHILTLDPLVVGLVELTLVVTAAAYLKRRRSPA